MQHYWKINKKKLHKKVFTYTKRTSTLNWFHSSRTEGKKKVSYHIELPPSWQVLPFQIKSTQYGTEMTCKLPARFRSNYQVNTLIEKRYTTQQWTKNTHGWFVHEHDMCDAFASGLDLPGCEIWKANPHPNLSPRE